jgi:toxin YoeB
MRIEAAHCDSFSGIGKPEPLWANLAGYWSRCIDEAHRLVYAVDDADFDVIACRGHNDDQRREPGLSCDESRLQPG